MPKATPEVRQANSAKRALKTLDTLSSPIAVDEAEEDTDLPTTVEEQQVSREMEEKQEPRKNGRDPSDMPSMQKKAPTEDFFEYLNRIAPQDWSNSKTAGIYIYKESPKGNVRINDEPLHRPITLQEIREEWAAKHGPGTYKIQFTTSLKHLSSAGERVTIDSNGVLLGGPLSNSLEGQAFNGGLPGISQAFSTVASISKEAASAAVEVVKSAQIEQNKGVDVAALVTAIAGMAPKPDNSIIQFLITDANRRAEQAEKDAERRERESERRERLYKEDAERRERLAKEESDRRERDRKEEMDRRDKEAHDRREDDRKWWEFIMKEKEKKDEFGLGGVLRDLVVPLVKERFEGGGQPEGWAGVAANFADRIPDLVSGVSAMMAAKNGATPQQVQQMTASNPQLQPPQQAQSGPQADFAELMKRIAKYLSRDDALWNTEDGRDYVLGMIEEEYPGIRQDLFVNQPREIIYQAIQSDPYGANILAHEIAKGFVEGVVNAIKAEETGEEVVEPPEDVPEPRKVNGRHKKQASAA